MARNYFFFPFWQKTGAALFLSLLIYACGESPLVGPNGPLSSTQQAGIKAVAARFNSTVQYEEQRLPGSDKRCFVLRLDSLSDAIKDYVSQPEMLITNAAWLFYKNLDAAEKGRLAQVQVDLPYRSDQATTRNVEATLLDSLCNRSALIDSAMNNLIQRDYRGFLGLLDTPLSPKMQRVAAEELQQTDSLYGGMRAYIPLGFKQFNRSDGVLFTRFYCIQVREKQNLNCTLELSLTDNQKLATFRFEHLF